MPPIQPNQGTPGRESSSSAAPAGGSEVSVSSAAREVLASLREVFRAETRLAVAEARASVSGLGRHAVMAGVFAAFALAGVLPLVAFLVIGLGRLLKDNYTLSSLLVGIVLTLFGALMARSYFRRAVKQDLSFPVTRGSLGQVGGRVEDHVVNLGNNVRAMKRGSK